MWNKFTLTVFGSESKKYLNAPGQKTGRLARQWSLQMLCICYYERILYHILLTKTEFSLLSEWYPVLFYRQTTIGACVTFCSWVLCVCVLL